MRSLIHAATCALALLLAPKSAVPAYQMGTQPQQDRKLPEVEQAILQEALHGASKAESRAEELIEAGKYAEALVISQAKYQEVQTPGLLRVIAESHLRAGNNDAALNTLLRLTEKRLDPAAYSRIGLALFRMGMIEESKARVRTELVTRYFGQERHLELEALLPVKNQLQLETFWLIAIAMQQGMQGSDKAAIYYYEQALRRSPGNRWVNYDLGVIYMRNDRLKDAIRLLSEASQGEDGYFAAAAANELRVAKRLADQQQRGKGAN